MGHRKGDPSTFFGKKHRPESIQAIVRAKGMENRSISKLYLQLDKVIIEQGMPARELSALLKRPRGSVRYTGWRAGKFVPNALTLEEIADVLGYEFILMKKETK